MNRLRVVQLLLSLGLLVLLFSITDLRQVGKVLLRFPVKWFLVAFLTVLVADIFNGVKLAILTGMGVTVSNVKLLYVVNLRTFFYSLILPGDAAGFGVRFIFLKRFVSTPTALCAILVDKGAYIAVACLLGMISAAFYSQAFLLLPLFGAILIGLLLAAVLIRSAVVEKIFAKGRITHWMAKMRSGFVPTTSNLVALPFSFFYVCAMGLFLKWLTVGMGIVVPIPVLISCVALTTVVQMLPITVSGLGVRESVFIGVLGWFSVASETALALGLLVFAVSLARGILGGLVNAATLFSSSTRETSV